MLNNNYVAKVGDFSLARRLEQNKEFVTSKSGTLPYLAPENIRKRGKSGVTYFDIVKIMHF